MAQLIRKGELSTTAWRVETYPPAIDSQCMAFSILPMDTQEDLSEEKLIGLQGMQIPIDADLEALSERIFSLKLICIDISDFNDGRVFSLAAQLKGRFHFSGELMASGSMIAEQLPLLARCGFDSFFINEPVDPSYLHTLSICFTDIMNSSRR